MKKTSEKINRQKKATFPPTTMTEEDEITYLRPMYQQAGILDDPYVQKYLNTPAIDYYGFETRDLIQPNTIQPRLVFYVDHARKVTQWNRPCPGPPESEEMLPRPADGSPPWYLLYGYRETQLRFECGENLAAYLEVSLYMRHLSPEWSVSRDYIDIRSARWSISITGI